jgi:hypothetical protein
MKKVIFIFAILLATTTMFSQTTERKQLFKSKLGYEIMQSIKETDTVVYFYYSYQNMKYKTITDLGSIFLTKKQDLKDFADNLILFSEKPKGVVLEYQNPKFSLLLHETLTSVFIFDKNNKFTSITKAKAKELGEEILSKLSLLKE